MNKNVLMMIAQLDKLQNFDIKSYVQEVIVLETNTYNQDELDSMYDDWLENELPLINESFQVMVY